MADKLIAWSAEAYRATAVYHTNMCVRSVEGEPILPAYGYVPQAMIIMWANGEDYNVKDIRKARCVLRATPFPALRERANSLTPVIMERSK